MGARYALWLMSGVLCAGKPGRQQLSAAIGSQNIVEIIVPTRGNTAYE